REERQRGKRVLLMNLRIFLWRNPWQRLEGQAVAERRIARNQEQMAGTEKPPAARPGELRGASAGARESAAAPRQRQHIPDDAVEPLLENTRQPGALLRIPQSRTERVHVGRQPAFLPQIVPDIFERRDTVPGIDGQRVCQRHDEASGVLLALAVIDRLVGDERVVIPDRLAVAPPPAPERPARQRFARIPLALAVMKKPARR